MKRPPYRSDKQYKEIEKFRDYELTQCIAYEMAIRNAENIKLAEELKKVDFLSDFNESWMERFIRCKSKNEMDRVIKDYITFSPNIEKRAKKDDEIIEKMHLQGFFSFTAPKSKRSTIAKMMKNPYIVDYHKRSSQREQAEKTNIVKDGKTLSSFYDGGTVRTTNGGVISYAELFPQLSRKLPSIPSQSSKEINLKLNLALPKEELLAYVGAIKDNFDKSGGEVFKVPSPVEALAEIDKDIFDIHIKMKKKGSKTNIAMPAKSRQEVYADLFFLYDTMSSDIFKTQGERIDHFRAQMIDYYAEKVRKYNGLADIDDVSEYIGTPRDQSVRDYYRMMQRYIEDFGYKKLLA